MNNVFRSIFFVMIFFQAGCNIEKVDEAKLLRVEVIAIHDEVMPLMGELKSLKKEVKLKTVNLLESDSSANAEKIKELRDLENQLDDAFEGMFVWMRQYKAPNESVSEEEAKAYLTQQKILVEKVNKDIKEALQAAKVELGKI